MTNTDYEMESSLNHASVIHPLAGEMDPSHVGMNTGTGVAVSVGVVDLFPVYDGNN